MAAYAGRTKADIVRGLFGDSRGKCKCLNDIANLGPDAASYFGYGADVGRCLKDPSTEVKCAALNALASIGAEGASSVDAVAAFLQEDDNEVKCFALAALGGIGPYSADYEQQIANFLEAQQPELRAAAACAIGGMKATMQVEPLKKCLKDADPKVVASAVSGAGQFGEAGAAFAKDIGECLSHQDPAVRLAAVKSLLNLGEAGDKETTKIVSCLADDDNMVRQAAVAHFEEATLGMRAFKLVPEVSKLLANSDGRAQAAAAVTLGNLQAKHGVLVKRLKAVNGEVPLKAKPLDIDTKKLIPLLSSKYEDETSRVLAAAGVQPKVSVELRRPACAAAATLALLGASDAIEPMVAQLADNAPTEVTGSLLTALGDLGGVPASMSSKIEAFLKSSAPAVRAGACLALGGLEQATSSISDDVASKMTDSHAVVRAAAALGVGKMKAEGLKHSDKIAELLEDQVPMVQKAAMKALGSIGDKGGMYACKIGKLASDGETSVRVVACETLAGMGERGAALSSEIAMLLQDHDSAVRKAAQECIDALS